MAYRTQINKRTLKAVAIAASNDSGRVSLCGVLVECRATTVTYVATDGHRMLVAQEDLPENQDWLEGAQPLIGDFIVPLDAIKALKVSGRPDAERDLMPLIAEEAAPKTAMLDDRRVTFIDGTFPNWRRAVPGEQELPTDGARINQFDSTYVGSFGNFAKMMAFPQPHIHHTAYNSATPITFGDHRAFGVLMPFRNEAPLWTGAPEWTKIALPAP